MEKEYCKNCTLSCCPASKWLMEAEEYKKKYEYEREQRQRAEADRKLLFIIGIFMGLIMAAGMAYYVISMVKDKDVETAQVYGYFFILCTIAPFSGGVCQREGVMLKTICRR